MVVPLDFQHSNWRHFRYADFPSGQTGIPPLPTNGTSKREWIGRPTDNKQPKEVVSFPTNCETPFTYLAENYPSYQEPGQSQPEWEWCQCQDKSDVGIIWQSFGHHKDTSTNILLKQIKKVINLDKEIEDIINTQIEILELKNAVTVIRNCLMSLVVECRW